MPFGRAWQVVGAACFLGAAVAVPAFAQAPHVMEPDAGRGQAGPVAQGEPATPDQRQYPSLKLSGFGDVNFSKTEHPEGPTGFTLGQLALHMASELSPRVTFFGEISFTARPDAGTGTPPVTGFNSEVERMILRFDQSDRLKVSFGRYHTPINYWNTAFHHGQWLQTTIARPEMIQFGGRFLPVHFVGALVEGSVPARGLNLNYKAGLGNGRASAISRGGDAGDVNGHRAWLANVFSKPDRFFGLEFGGSVYGDQVTTTAGDFDEQILSAFAVWQKEDPELIAEVASVRHEAAGGSATWSHAYYVQAAYRLPQLDRVLKPYVRFEHVGVDPLDLVFQTVPKLDGTTLGVRYDASALTALKTEYRTWTRGDGSIRNHGGFFQVCFTF